MIQTPHFYIELNANLYLKNPASSNLGKEIVQKGIELMDEIGFEKFTFKKLAAQIDTTEATVYRYFENKHLFLVYVTNYYWQTMENILAYETSNLASPKLRIERLIHLICKTFEQGQMCHWMELSNLQQLVMHEASKTYLTTDVDQENKAGYFAAYKQFVEVASFLIQSYKPEFPYAHALVSTMLESVWQQRFFSKHLPKLTDNLKTDAQLEAFCLHLCFGMLEQKTNNK